jgi:hypothetical protein
MSEMEKAGITQFGRCPLVAGVDVDRSDMFRVGRERNSIGLIPRRINSAYGWTSASSVESRIDNACIADSSRILSTTDAHGCTTEIRMHINKYLFSRCFCIERA